MCSSPNLHAPAFLTSRSLKRHLAQTGSDRKGNYNGEFEMTKLSDLHDKWMRQPEYREAHAALAPEYEQARHAIESRLQANLAKIKAATKLRTNTRDRTTPTS